MNPRPVHHRTVPVETSSNGYLGGFADPTPEQAADRVGRDDGIRTIRAAVGLRLRRWQMYRLGKRYAVNLTPSPYAKGERRPPRDHRNGYPIIHEQTGRTYPSVVAAAVSLKLGHQSILRGLRGERPPSLRGNTFRRAEGAENDLRQRALAG
jgi:hypothetical protein